MKKITFLKLIFLLSTLLGSDGIKGQYSIIEFSFTASSMGVPVPLDSIRIMNLSYDGDTILYAPDTVLILSFLVTSDENVYHFADNFSVNQNFPNPFSELTTFSISIAEKGSTKISVRNLLGQEVAFLSMILDRGLHWFNFYPGNDKVYLVTVNHNGLIKSLKIISKGMSPDPKLVYSGEENPSVFYKSNKIGASFPYTLGDNLHFTGYANTVTSTTGSAEISDTPMSSQTYQFNIIEGIRCPGDPIVTDIDGNTYNTVLIGNQCWMKENLKTTTYRNGTPIPLVEIWHNWQYLSTGAYVWYGNESNWKHKYGALYNWHAVNNPNGICPEGWHVPRNGEWTALSDFIGGTSSPNGNKLKSCFQVKSALGEPCYLTDHPRWEMDDFNHGTNDFGFSGFPGGQRSQDGDYYNLGYTGYWWSSTPYYYWPTNAFLRRLHYNNGVFATHSFDQTAGYSVRCLRNDGDTLPVADFTANPTIGMSPFTVDFIDLTTNDPITWLWDFGDGNTSDKYNPSHTYPIAGTYTVQLTISNGHGSDTAIKTDFVTSYIINATPCPGSPTVTDIDGNVYNTVLIGDQCWMRENLKTTRYNNGASIPYVYSTNSWSSLTTGAYVWNQTSFTWKDKYGALYNWFAVVDANGLCPTGWHVPTKNEWDILTNYIGGNISVRGTKLKSCRQVDSPLGGDCIAPLHPRWDFSANQNGLDDYGFSGLPGGYRNQFGNFTAPGQRGYWWTSSENPPSGAWAKVLKNNTGNVEEESSNKKSGYSVRCLMD